MILAAASVGLAGVLFRAHELGKINRHRDQARAVIKSFADQFSRLQVAETDATTHLVTTRTFFTDTTAKTGLGLTFNNVSGDATNGLVITLGNWMDSSVTATVWREVSELDESSGATNTDSSNTAAGRMLQGTFTITYTINNRVFTQSVTVARSAK